ncbi:hypothetical protein BH23BAC4_BH23BAC4_09140 [soil metagenome]
MSGSHLFVTGSDFPEAGSHLFVTGNHFPETGSHLFVTGNDFPEAGSHLFVTGTVFSHVARHFQGSGRGICATGAESFNAQPVHHRLGVSTIDRLVCDLPGTSP